MLLLLDYFFNYLDEVTFGGALLFDVAVIMFIVVCCSVFKEDKTAQRNEGF